MRGGSKVPTLDLPDHDDVQRPFWSISSHSVYDGMSDIYVELPEGVAAMLIIRSTFNRNGLFLTSGLYDSGYKGHLGFALHNRADAQARVAPGTRVGQVIFVSSDSAGMYAGGWNHDQGTHHSDEAPIGPGSDDYGDKPLLW